MKREITRNDAGFTLIELMISFALALIILASTVQLFKSGVEASTFISQRAELQQNARAAINFISKDISMAGAGLPPGGIQLPSGGASTTARYACDQLGNCYIPNHLYPTGNYMYGIIPGANNGVQNGVNIPATGQGADSITVAYLDYAFPLNQYVCVVTSGSTISMTVPAPAPVPALTPINAPGVGLQAGDLVMVVGGNIWRRSDHRRSSVHFQPQRGAAGGAEQLHRHPLRGGHIFPASTGRLAISPADAAGERSDTSTGGRRHYWHDAVLRPV